MLGPACAEPAMVKDQDGIHAELVVSEAAARLQWRFTKPPPHPLDQVVASIGGRPLGTPTITAARSSAVVALLDISGIHRQEQIERSKMAMLLLAARKPEDVAMAFAVYALEGSLLVPAGDDPNAILDLLARIPALDEEANLSGALISSMRMLENLPATRRAIYVLCDGHNDGTIALADLGELARRTGVNLFFIVAPSDRTADVPALARLAEATGGRLVEAKDIAAFLADPFAALDSGAELVFPLDAARRFFWQPQSTIQVVMRYGDKSLEMTAPVVVTSASIADTAAYAWRDHAMFVVAAGGCLALVLGGAGWLGFSRRRSAAMEGSPAATIHAVIEDVEGGRVFPLNRPLTRIGRGGDNDIIIDDATVGRAHAIIQQVGDDTFAITDQASANGTELNNVRIETARLGDGDIISLGTRTLRFRVHAGTRTR